MQIPYSVETRPDTGLYNGKLGIWLFLASELMLFAGLFSSYVLLRTGAAEWPRHVLPVGHRNKGLDGLHAAGDGFDERQE